MELWNVQHPSALVVGPFQMIRGDDHCRSEIEDASIISKGNMIVVVVVVVVEQGIVLSRFLVQ